MTIRLIAVDMDGTFLNDKKSYDVPRFNQQFQQLKELGIKFVVASGNQYYQLVSFFPELRPQLSFVAENGALVFDGMEQLWHAELAAADYQHILDVLDNFPDLTYVACGLKSAYTQRGASRQFMDLMAKHYHRLEVRDSLRDIDDVMFKFSLNLPDNEIPELIKRLHQELNGSVRPVTSGFGFVDLILPGAHKASGLQRLLDRWGIAAEDCVALGDSANDIEMLKLVGYSFAMENAAPEVVASARYRAPSNNASGVLDVIDWVLKGQAPFDQQR